MDDSSTKYRTRINEVLNRLEKGTGKAFGRIPPDTWFLPLENTTIHIKLNGPWITFATEVMEDIRDGTSENERDFWKEIAKENGRLNGVKLGLDEDVGKIMFNSEYSSSEIALEKFVEILILHYNRHKQRANWVITLAYNLGLKIRNL